MDGIHKPLGGLLVYNLLENCMFSVSTSNYSVWHEFLWNSVYCYQLVLLDIFIPWHYICRFNTTVHPVTSRGCACAFKGELMLSWLWQWSELEADFIATIPLVMELKNKNKNKIKNYSPVSFSHSIYYK